LFNVEKESTTPCNLQAPINKLLAFLLLFNYNNSSSKSIQYKSFFHPIALNLPCYFHSQNIYLHSPIHLKSSQKLTVRIEYLT